MTFSNQALAILAATALILVALFVFVPPIPQDPAYHEFADSRAILGVANFWNVLSNAPFLVIGLWGIVYIWRHSHEVCLPGLELPYLVFFAGIFLTAFGSGYYHLVPANEPLVWDRLPMTIGFAGLFAIVLGEFVSPTIGRAVVIPLLLLGVASVEYWAWTENQGAGDLRLYAIVQFLPMMLIPVVLLTYQPVVGSARYFWFMILFYVLAKLAEQLDGAIFLAGSLISGHSLKHLFAAMVPATMLYVLMQRRLIPEAANDD